MSTPHRRIYVASSWRNGMQPAVVQTLRSIPTFEVYDFRNPRPGEHGFDWAEIDPHWLDWGPEELVRALGHPTAEAGYRSDHDAMQWADTFVLVLPCGRSAHLEAGWAAGSGKDTFALLDEDGFEPELMYRMLDKLCVSMLDLLGALGVED